MRIGVIQMVSTPDPDHNLRSAVGLLEAAAADGAELALLPEYFCLMGRRDDDKLRVAEPFGRGPLQDTLAGAASRLGLWIVAGTLPLQCDTPGRVRNSSLVWGPDGRCAARYDKLHLFRFQQGGESYDESRVLERGTAPVTVEVPSRDGHRWRFGLSVCYDLRFPELYRHYSAAGAHAALVPSAFTHTTGQAHWELLLRARAVENLMFVAAAAQGGEHVNGRRTWGHSLAVDPWGRVLGCLEQGEGVVTVDLDMAALLQYRQRLPALEHRLL